MVMLKVNIIGKEYFKIHCGVKYSNAYIAQKYSFHSNNIHKTLYIWDNVYYQPFEEFKS